ncbi:MAG: nicotinate-nucleotide--dimethylbenzimidazole phosphoribosyltransferase [Planctomycetes bacterium]|nr:nicotinate-nucleotide--dimethylbenzimidazole phosphoribosyltransferase [Planctomycetota bacterium]
MIEFDIKPVSEYIAGGLRQKIDEKTKPVGALGMLEDVAMTIGRIQNTLAPELRNPHIAVFAGDHGIAKEGVVNLYPQEVTWQMVFNFLDGGAAINVFARQHGITVKIVDAGVNFDFEPGAKLIHAKVAKGTRNYLYEPAMTNEQCETAMERGANVISEINDNDCNVIGFGEMGIGNSSAAALIMSAITGAAIDDCVGGGTGLEGDGIARKCAVLRKAMEKRGPCESPTSILSTFGGFEIAMIAGGMLRAAERRMAILVDGFIATSAFLIADAIDSNVRGYSIFSHCSSERGHRRMLDYLGVEPLMNLSMRLGEGTGAAVAYPVIESALRFLREMASFESAGVNKSEK